jgi:hypothetical protein
VVILSQCLLSADQISHVQHYNSQIIKHENKTSS